MTSLFNILAFYSGFRLIRFIQPELLENLSSDEKEAMEAINEYDDFVFYLVNLNQIVVVDELSGNVSGFYSSVKELFNQLMDFVRETV